MTPNPPAAAAWCATAFFLVLVSFSLVTIEHLKLAYLADGGTPWRQIRVQDVALVAAGTLLFAATIVLEVRAQAVRRLIAGEAPRSLLLVLGAALLWFAHALLAPGLLVTGDAGSHVSRVAHLMAALRDGSSLTWDNYYFAGGPLLQFSGPVFHWLATAPGLAFGDATEGVKTLVVACRLLGAGLMYAFLRRIGVGRPASCLGALFYAGAFYQTYLFSIRSTFPQAINLAAMPAILLCVEGIIVPRRFMAASSIGLCLAGVMMIGNHQPTAVVAGLYVAAYAWVRVRAEGGHIRDFAPLALAGVVIAVASVYFTLPFLAEKASTADNFSAAIVGLRWPDIPTLLLWGRAGKDASYAAYLGLSVVLCALSGAVAIGAGGVARRTARFWVLFAGLALASLFIAGSYVRETIFTLFFVSIMAAVAVQAWAEAAPLWRGTPALVLILFLLDIGPLAVQPWVRPDLAEAARAGDYLAAAAAGQRVLEVDFDRTGTHVPVGPGASPLLYARVQALYGPHKMDATPAHNAMVAVSQRAEADLAKGGQLAPATAGLLSLYNVGWIVGMRGAHMGLPADWPGVAADPLLGNIERIATASPFVTTAQLQQMPRPASFGGPPLWATDFPSGRGRQAAIDAARCWQLMAVDLARHAANSVLVADLPAGPDWRAGEPGTPPPHAVMLEYLVAPGHVHLAVQADAGGFIRLAHPVFPALVVTLNGRRTAPASDVFSMMVLPLRAGRNDIAIAAAASPLRRICFWITALSLLGLTLAFPATVLQSARK